MSINKNQYAEIIEIASSFLNFEGYVGVECRFCYMPNNVIQNPNGWWCGCNFYNRGSTGENPPFKNAKYIQRIPYVDIILAQPDSIQTIFYNEE